MRRVSLWGCAFLLLFFLPSYSKGGGGAADQLKQSVDRILELLGDSSLKSPDKKLERRNRIFKIVEERFDFGEMSKRSMGEYWPKLSEAEQKEFEVSFSSLLENTYISKIERYSNQRVEFSESRPKGEKFFYVHTEIVSAERVIPVDYSLHQVGDQWFVYDVNIEGVSLVTNYRSQFLETMRKEGFKGLMAKIAEKARQLEAR